MQTLDTIRDQITELINNSLFELNEIVIEQLKEMFNQNSNICDYVVVDVSTTKETLFDIMIKLNDNESFFYLPVKITHESI